MPDAWATDHLFGGQRPERSGSVHPDARIAQLAARQHAVVERLQLRRLGLTERQIDRRVERGYLHLLHRGVYAVGQPAVSDRGRWLAAVLACGFGSALSHFSAAALLDLRATARARIDVSVRWDTGRRRPGLRVHRPFDLFDEDLTEEAGIAVTAAPRVIVDLAAELRKPALERLIDRAAILGVFDLAAVDGILARRPRRAGAPLLRELLAEHRPAVFTRSDLEDRVLEMCRGAGLPEPEVNAHVELLDGSFVEVDFLWRRQRLIVEADGHAFHSTPLSFERDREKHADLVAAGWRVVRVTWRQVTRDRARTARRLAALLAQPVGR